MRMSKHATTDQKLDNWKPVHVADYEAALRWAAGVVYDEISRATVQQGRAAGAAASRIEARIRELEGQHE